MAVALYGRVSTVRQFEKDLSIPDQIKQMREWCEQHGYVVAKAFIEKGASGTDDRRPAFQELIAEACQKPSPYEAVIVHSLSRFYRDSLEFALYERRLNQCGVKLISITQQTSDDPSGEMARKIFSIFDEYQSKENGKHTLRAMRENARQGYWNGSRPPFGYTTEVVMLSKDKVKKRLVVDEAEARIVRQIFEGYLRGDSGAGQGAKLIATELNRLGYTHRGTTWTRGRVHEVLSNSTYVGDFYFNRVCNKTGEKKPEAEWIHMSVPAIIDRNTFETVQQRKASRSADVVNPAIVGSKTLLTGIAKCGLCGAGMTLVTGKGGKYRYYKCATRTCKGNHLCENPAMPMDKLDDAILGLLAEQVFTPERVMAMLTELRGEIEACQNKEKNEIAGLQKEMEELDKATARLYEAVEKGLFPLDQTLRVRSEKLQAQREEVVSKMNRFSRRRALPEIQAGQVSNFCKALREKLLDRSSGFGKAYLNCLVNEVRVTGGEVLVTGSKEKLAMAVADTKKGTSIEVPKSVLGWLPDLGSNQGPTD